MAAAALVTAACAARGPYVVSIPQPGVSAVSRIEDITSYAVATATIATILERDLGFARFPLTLHLYPGRRAFETALLESGYDASLARNTATHMSGVGGFRHVFLNESALADLPWPGRVGLLAHEMTHSLQYELGGGTRGASDQWLREGFADWIEAKVLDRLGVLSFDAFKRRHLNDLRASSRSRALRLDEMSTFPQWVALGGRRDIAPYAEAFLAVDLLIQRHGVLAVVRYFRRFAEVQDRAGNFRSAFGEELAAFQTAVDALLRKYGGSGGRASEWNSRSHK